MVPPAMPFGSLWVVYQLPGQQGQHGLVGAAGRPGKQADACPGQGTDRAAADAAADDRVYALALWPLAVASTTAVSKIMPLSTVYSLNCAAWPKCW